MGLKHTTIIAALACFAMTGMNTPVFAESGIVVPRGPVLSSRDPVFAGLLLSPGYSKCRQLRSYYDWKCTYGGVARHYDRFGNPKYDDEKPSLRAKSVKSKKAARVAKSAKRKN